MRSTRSRACVREMVRPPPVCQPSESAGNDSDVSTCMHVRHQERERRDPRLCDMSHDSWLFFLSVLMCSPRSRAQLAGCLSRCLPASQDARLVSLVLVSLRLGKRDGENSDRVVVGGRG